MAVALYFTIRTFKQLKSAHQIQLGEKFYTDMQQVRRDLGPYFDQDRSKDGFQEKLSLQDEVTFNVLEWNAYLIRTGQIEDRRLIKHFKETFLEWYDKVFLVTVKPDDRAKYDEFTELVKELKSNKYG